MDRSRGSKRFSNLNSLDRGIGQRERSWFKTKNTLHANYLCMIDQGRRPGTSFAGADAAPVTVDMAAEGLKGRHKLALPSD